MHILFLPSWYPEGTDDFSGSFFREQADAFVAEGHEVGVLSVRGIPLYQLPLYRARAVRCKSRIEGAVRVFRSDALLPTPKLHRVNLAALERRWNELFDRYVDEYGKPDVLNAHAMFPAGIIASRISRRTGIPFVITEHRPSSMRLVRSPGYRGPALRAAREALGLVAVARGFVPELDQTYGVKKWQYLPGLLSPQFESISVRSPAPAPFVFGHVSHLDPGKRVDLLIEAFVAAFRNDQEVVLRVAGNSPHRVSLEALVERLNTSAVEFVGAVGRNEVVDEFSKAHVFVLTSEKEAFGTVLWEAMACGLPILSTDTWAGRNAVTAETGIVTPVDELLPLVDSLRKIKAEFASFDADRIREICVNHCGRDAFVSQYIRLYEGRGVGE